MKNINKKALIIIIFFILLIFIIWLVILNEKRINVVNKVLEFKNNNYLYEINYPFFKIAKLDYLVNDYIEENIKEVSNNLDNSFKKMFVDYDYFIKDNIIFMTFYKHLIYENILNYDIWEIKYELKTSKIERNNLKKELNEKVSYDFVNNKEIDKNKKMIAFTFDDGPSYNTIKIINTLVKYNAKASFFLVGNKLDNYPKTLQLLVDNDMDIANHTYSHKLLSGLSSEKIEEEIVKTNEKITSLTNVIPVFFRPSYGTINERIKNISKNVVGMPIILWNLDTLDWKNHNSNKIKEKILKYASDGDIILMHDTYSATVNALEKVLPLLIEQGYQIVSVKDLFYYKNVIPKLGYGYGYIS